MGVGAEDKRKEGSWRGNVKNGWNEQGSVLSVPWYCLSKDVFCLSKDRSHVRYLINHLLILQH